MMPLGIRFQGVGLFAESPYRTEKDVKEWLVDKDNKITKGLVLAKSFDPLIGSDEVVFLPNANAHEQGISLGHHSAIQAITDDHDAGKIDFKTVGFKTVKEKLVEFFDSLDLNTLEPDLKAVVEANKDAWTGIARSEAEES